MNVIAHDVIAESGCGPPFVAIDDGGFAPDAGSEAAYVEALFLSLRSCATHTAGPLRAVAGLAEAVDAGTLRPSEARAVCDEVADRFRGMSTMPRERLALVERFLAVLFR